MWGAEWVEGGQYMLQPDARRYEQYERCFAAVVRHCATSRCFPTRFLLRSITPGLSLEAARAFDYAACCPDYGPFPTGGFLGLPVA